jgi:hypothetical protein
MQSRRSRYHIRNLPVLLLGSLLLLFSIYALFWYGQMRAFRAEVAAMQNGQGNLFDIEARDTVFSGFPYRLQASFEDARLVRQRSDYIVSLQAPRFEMTRLLWSPGHWVLMADAPRIIFRSRGGSAPLHLAFEAATLQSSLRFSPQKVDRLSFEFTQIRWTEGHRFAQPILMRDLQLHVRDSVVSSAQGDAPKPKNVFANVRLVAGGVQTANSAPFNMDFYVDLTGGKRLDDSAPALADWRLHGGTMAINRFILARPGLEWSAQGTLGLAASGRLSGAGRLKTNALAQTQLALAGNAAAVPASAATSETPWLVTDGKLFIDGIAASEIPFSLVDALR